MDQMEQLLGMLAIEGEVAEAIGDADPDDVSGYGPDGYSDDPFSAA